MIAGHAYRVLLLLDLLLVRASSVLCCCCCAHKTQSIQLKREKDNGTMKKTSVLVLVLVAAIVGCAKAGDYQDGYEDGKYECKELFSGDCDDSWAIEDLCTEELIDGMFRRHRRDSPSDRSYKRGARKGVKKAIRKIEKECLHTDIGQCNDLGENAAEVSDAALLQSPASYASLYNHLFDQTGNCDGPV